MTVNDLTGTGTTQVAIDLSGTPGSGQGDGATDTVNVLGTAGDDHIAIASSGTSVVVNGLAAQVKISGADATDRLVVNGGGGNDVINAAGLHAGQVSLILNGGDGDDTIVGSAGNDTVNGGRGNDVASLGAGDDSFVWNSGDGSDTVDGGAGNDTLLFNGANINEVIDISASNGRAIFTRDIASITMDLDNVETIDFTARGGEDTDHGQRPFHDRRQARGDQSGNRRRAAASVTARPTPSSSMRPRATTSSTSPRTTASLRCPGWLKT